MTNKLVSLSSLPPLLLPSLAKASTSMLKELTTSVDSQAFDGSFLLLDDDDSSPQSTEHKCRLFWEQSRGLEVTSIAWNSKGSLLAAAYGCRGNDQEPSPALETATGALVVWDGFNQSIPTKVIEHSSHLSCVVAHPEKSSIFAAGSIDGEVIMYDMSREEPLVACSSIGLYFHQEAISSLAWRNDALVHDWLLCSISRDGNLLLWSANSKLKYPVQGKNFSFGIASGAFLGEQGALLVGSECGRLQRAPISVDAGKPTTAVKGTEMKWSKGALETIARVSPEHREQLVRAAEDRAKRKKKKGIDSLAVFDSRPPIQMIYPNLMDFEYSNHLGSVVCVDAHIFDTTLFLSCSTDGEVRLYRTTQERPIAVIEPSPSSNDLSCSPIFAAMFSPTKPTVMAAGSADGRVFIYDLGTSVDVAADILDAEGIGDEQPAGVNSIAFNKRSPELFASGNANGTIDIWRLPKKMYCKCQTDRVPRRQTDEVDLCLGSSR